MYVCMWDLCVLLYVYYCYYYTCTHPYIPPRAHTGVANPRGGPRVCALRPPPVNSRRNNQDTNKPTNNDLHSLPPQRYIDTCSIYIYICIYKYMCVCSPTHATSPPPLQNSAYGAHADRRHHHHTTHNRHTDTPTHQNNLPIPPSQTTTTAPTAPTPTTSPRSPGRPAGGSSARAAKT